MTHARIRGLTIMLAMLSVGLTTLLSYRAQLPTSTVLEIVAAAAFVSYLLRALPHWLSADGNHLATVLTLVLGGGSAIVTALLGEKAGIDPQTAMLLAVAQATLGQGLNMLESPSEGPPRRDDLTDAAVASRQ